MSIREPLKDDPRKLAWKNLFNKLEISKERMEKISMLSNKDLAQEILEKVWAHTSIYTEQYDLLEEAIERLKVA